MSDKLWRLNPPQIKHTDEELEKIRKVCKNDKINWNDIKRRIIVCIAHFFLERKTNYEFYKRRFKKKNR